MGKKVKYISALLSYVLIICLIVGLFPATSFAKSSIPMTEATKPTKKIVETTEAEKPQKQKTMQVTDVKTKKTREVEIEEEKEEETPITTQTVQQTTAKEFPEQRDAEENTENCDGTHTGWTALTGITTNLENGKKYHLTSDLTGDITIPVGADVTLCLSGHTITGSGNGSVITVNGKLTLCDCNKTNPGKITGGKAFNGGGGVFVNENASFTMNNGIISKNKGTYYGGGVNVASNATFTMNNGTISENESNSSGGGVYVNKNATFIMKNGAINKNQCSSYGGGVFVNESASFTMINGSICENHAIDDNEISASGGGVFVQGENAIFIMIDGIISNNTSIITGGGVDVGNNATFIMKHGTISKNQKANFGGGVSVHGRSTFTMNNGIISENTASEGGGVYIDNSTFTMDDGTISENIGSNHGGGIYVSSSTFTMKNGTISKNKSFDSGGGGVYISVSTFTMENGTISENETNYYGGGVFISSHSTFTMNDGAIHDNVVKNTYDPSKSYGGGVCLDIWNIFNMDGGKIYNNTATTGGGVSIGTYYGGYGGYENTFNMSGGEIYNNTANDNGGGVYITEYTFQSGHDNIFNISSGKIYQNTATNNGGGVYININSIFNVSDDSVITDNKETTNNSANNVFLLKDEIINVVGELEQDANIGVTVEDPPTEKNPSRKIAEGNGYTILEDAQEKFKSDNSAYRAIFHDDKAIYLEKAPDEKKVTFNYQYKEIENKIINIEVGKTVTEPDKPTREGHTFGGWYKEDTYENKWDFDTDTVTKDMTLYAKWTENEYTVIFNSQDGSPAPAEQKVKHGGKAKKPDDPIKKDCKFDGWYKEQEYTTAWDFANDTVTKDMTLYAKWIPKQYTVTFNSQDGSPVDSQTIEHGNTVTKTADPTKTGYDFGGWYEEQECNTAWDFATPVTSNMTLYAKWIQNETPTPPEEKYTVTFDSKGGTGVSSQEVESGKTVTKPADPTKNGFTFDGWYKEQEYTTAWNFATPVTANMTLYAKWIQNETPIPPEEKYTVTFDSKGGTGVSSQIVKANQKAAKPDPDPTREGYTFDGWYQNEDFSGGKWDFYNDIVTENIILYAKWTEETTVDPTPPAEVNYTITFDSQGGSDVPTQTVEKGKTVAKPAAPTKTSFTFAGWFTDKAYTQEYDFDTAVIADMTLFAKWEENKTTPSNPTLPTIKYYTVTFESNGGSAIPSQTISSGRTATMPQNPTKNDCEFLGWFVDKDFNEIYRFSTPITKDIIIYAKWKSDDCIVTFDSNGGSEIPIQIIEAGKTATMPENPTKSDYEFLGWFADKDFNEIYHFNTPIMEDITIYAKWKSKIRSSGGGGGGGHYRTGTWVTEEPEKQHQIVKLGCPRDETCPLWKFTDVDRWAWYHDGSHYCVEHGLIVGTTNTTFSPHIPITRAMVVAILWRIEDKPLVNDVITFQDVNESEYYAEAVRWAAHNGIVSGYSRTVFAPDDSITREQMASILYRYTQYKNRDVSGRADISNYEDKNEISNYALTAIQWACDVGIINGINATTLSPKGTTTRAQAAQMFKAYLEQL